MSKFLDTLRPKIQTHFQIYSDKLQSAKKSFAKNMASDEEIVIQNDLCSSCGSNYDNSLIQSPIYGAS